MYGCAMVVVVVFCVGGKDPVLHLRYFYELLGKIEEEWNAFSFGGVSTNYLLPGIRSCYHSPPTRRGCS